MPPHAHDDHHDHEHHDHGHPHAADHPAAPAAGVADYYLEQLLTILICGAMGVVAILMYQFGTLGAILSTQFHPMVLAGGIVLLVLTAFRAAAIWADTGVAATHDHDHGPDCGHGPAACGHNHDHDHPHSHGGIFWRVVVLAFPLLLFCLGMPGQGGYSNEHKAKILGSDAKLGRLADVRAKDGNVATFDFSQISDAAFDPVQRDKFHGATVRVKGQLKEVGEREYTLFTMKYTCCVADSVPLKGRIVTEFTPYHVKNFDWVWATGVLQFVESPTTKQFIPVIQVQDEKGLQKTDPAPNS